MKHKEEDRGHPGAYAGLAKAEFDESVNAPKQAGSILAGSVSESAVRTIRQIGSELREAAGTCTDPSRAAPTQRRSDVAKPINGTASASWLRRGARGG